MSAIIRSIPAFRSLAGPSLRRSLHSSTYVPFPSPFPTHPLTHTHLLPSFRSLSVACASHGYGSGPADNDSSVPPATTEYLEKHGSPEGKDIPSPDAKDLPTPNSSSEKSSGDKSKPHYVCDPETKGDNDTPELVKPEDKK